MNKMLYKATLYMCWYFSVSPTSLSLSCLWGVVAVVWTEIWWC